MIIHEAFTHTLSLSLSHKTLAWKEKNKCAPLKSLNWMINRHEEAAAPLLREGQLLVGPGDGKPLILKPLFLSC